MLIWAVHGMFCPPAGYSNYAERAVRGSMAGSVGTVKEFIEEVHTQIRPAAREEAYDMEKFKVRDQLFILVNQ